MQSLSQCETAKEPQFFFQKPTLRLLVIGFLFITALGIRLYRIGDPLVEFHLGRQYRGAVIARHYYFETIESIPEYRRHIASINKQREPILEPPILEFIAALAYRIAGGEHLWIPRLLSSIFWLIGGVFLYLIVKNIVNPDAAVVSTAFYLLVPFGVSATRTFQPDSMMIMMFLLSIFAILRYHDRASIRRLMIAACVSAGAMFIKPVCLFPIFGVFVSLAICRQDIRRSVISPDFLIFACVSLLPTIIYYSYGIFLTESLQSQTWIRFFPQLLLIPSFWKYWFANIMVAVGYIAFIGALLGVPMSPKGWPRNLLIGLWIGYFVFGLVFALHIHTHNYYQLQLIPIVALSFGSIVALIMNRLRQVCAQWHWRMAILGILLLMVIINIREAQEKLIHPDPRRELKIAQEIGEVVGHSTKTVFLDPHFGLLLEYYGELSGVNWPRKPDNLIPTVKAVGILEVVGLGEMIGVRKNAEEYFNALYLEHSPEYFIVTALHEFERQTDLKQFLTREFPILVENDDYLIFDLRREN